MKLKTTRAESGEAGYLGHPNGKNPIGNAAPVGAEFVSRFSSVTPNDFWFPKAPSLVQQ